MVNKSTNSREAGKHMGPDLSSQGLQLMPRLFDNFYTATWVLLTAPEKAVKGREGNRAVVVSSSNRREGASTIALNLAHAFATSSVKSVVLVDGNLRDPALHEFFSRKREGGLTELVHGEIGFEQAVTEVKPKRLHFNLLGPPGYRIPSCSMKCRSLKDCLTS